MLTIARTYVYQPPEASEGKDWKGKGRDHTNNKKQNRRAGCDEDDGGNAAAMMLRPLCWI